jgi:hypothetical protein
MKGRFYMAEKTRYEQEKRRLTDKSQQPTEEDIRSFMGDDAWQRLLLLEKTLCEYYDLNRELKFPFGNDYGWGFRYTHKKSLLLYVFLRKAVSVVPFRLTTKARKK